MEATRISFMDIENAISRENHDITVGQIDVGPMERTLKVKGQFTDAKSMKDIVVRSSAQGGWAYLRHSSGN